eukprot:TRINITY_DN20336_c0_g1_i1.p2 TRINITY_DN20336_c0_g1~~TRINITY_DN20336_c0_g1_i1.p2  ORF type:complete len:246 (+),score=100.67 TRINITY_DN20336_c0_g1_i1:71-808(+)
MADIVMAGLTVKRSGAGSGDKPPSSKKGRQEEKDKDKVDDLTVLVAQLTLSVAREQALLKSILVTVVLIDRNTELGKAVANTVKDTHKAYNEQIKEMDAEARASFGSPHIFVFLAFLQVLMQHAVSKKLTHFEKTFKVLKDNMDSQVEEMFKGRPMGAKVEGDPKDAVVRELVTCKVKVCRVLKCFAPHLARVELCMDAQWQEMKDTFVKMLAAEAKGQVRHGQAPKADLERKIAKRIGAGAKQD